jgi:predicted metal-dependent phosphoesterase TrpH
VELNTRYGHLLVYGVYVYEIVGARLRHRALDELSKQIASKDVNVHSLAGVFQGFYYKIFSEMDKVITMVHDDGGAVVLPHPFGGYDPTTTNLRYYLDRYLASLGAQTGPVKTDCLLAYVRQEDPSFFSMLHHIDGVEVLNPLCRGVENRAASVLADYLHKNEIGASDCHSPDEVGVCATALSDKIDSEEEFLRQIKRYGTTNAKVNLKKDEIWPWFGNEKQETFMLFHSL